MSISCSLARVTQCPPTSVKYVHFGGICGIDLNLYSPYPDISDKRAFALIRNPVLYMQRINYSKSRYFFRKVEFIILRFGNLVTGDDNIWTKMRKSTPLYVIPFHVTSFRPKTKPIRKAGANSQKKTESSTTLLLIRCSCAVIICPMH